MVFPCNAGITCACRTYVTPPCAAITGGASLCSYHGWRFDGDGRTQHIPQADDPAAHATAIASKRACAVSFPTTVQPLAQYPTPCSHDAALCTAAHGQLRAYVPEIMADAVRR